jgi:hypothetical protein
MTHQIAQKVAPSGEAILWLERAVEIRAALLDARLLRREAKSVLSSLPLGCDLLAWSPEGFAIAAVASVVADDLGREVNVHHASLIAPLAPLPDRGRWSWVAVEELLGLGPVRSWAAEWAYERGGWQHHERVSLV